jgi:hypothetical protein
LLNWFTFSKNALWLKTVTQKSVKKMRDEYYAAAQNQKQAKASATDDMLRSLLRKAVADGEICDVPGQGGRYQMLQNTTVQRIQEQLFDSGCSISKSQIIKRSKPFIAAAKRKSNANIPTQA